MKNFHQQQIATALKDNEKGYPLNISFGNKGRLISVPLYKIEQISEILGDKFPKGISSYLETHSDIAKYLQGTEDNEECMSYKVREDKGLGGIYELTESLTDKFEILHKDNEWESDYFDTLEEFLSNEETNFKTK